MGKHAYNILIAATGSVAALKIPTLLNSLTELSYSDQSSHTYEIRLIVTEHAKHFFNTAEFPPEVLMYDDNLEWQTWHKRGDPVLHIDLGKWADIMVMAPLDANTLAKMAQGICDNLITCVTRAWDMSKPLLFCPAMNTRMWEHPITAKQIATLKEWGHTEIPPVSKTLMCGDTGIGAMAEVLDIVETIKNLSEKTQK